MPTEISNVKQSTFVSHIILRLSAKVSVRGEKIDTISAHNSIFDQAGYIAVAKFGNAWSAERCEDYCQSITKLKRPLLIIVIKSDEEFAGWSAPLKSVFPADDRRSRQLVIPPYYRELANQPSLLDTPLATKPGMWFITTAKFKSYPLTKLRLVSNGRRVSVVLRETRTAMMLVSDETPRKISTSGRTKLRWPLK